MYYIHIYKELHNIYTSCQHTEYFHLAHQTLGETLATARAYISKLFSEWDTRRHGKPLPQQQFTFPSANDIEYELMELNVPRKEIINYKRPYPYLFSLQISLIKEKIGRSQPLTNKHSQKDAPTTAPSAEPDIFLLRNDHRQGYYNARHPRDEGNAKG